MMFFVFFGACYLTVLVWETSVNKCPIFDFPSHNFKVQYHTLLPLFIFPSEDFWTILCAEVILYL